LLAIKAVALGPYRCYPLPKIIANFKEYTLKEKIYQAVEEAVRAAEFLKKPQVTDFLEKATQICASAFKQKKKLLVAGNGGSLCDADHLAEELTGQFREKRPALPAISLSGPGHLTCVANDMGFEEVFARGVEAYGQPEDVLVILTTSGNSTNLVRAVQQAKKQNMCTVALLGKTGGRLKGMCDLELIVDGFSYSDRVQEVHMAVLHILTECIEHQLFYS
jgi:D-sedoheptulose 7-phosphate isomerase